MGLDLGINDPESGIKWLPKAWKESYLLSRFHPMERLLLPDQILSAMLRKVTRAGKSPMRP